MSGKSNVIWFLEQRGHEATAQRVADVLECAKQAKSILSEEQVLAAAKIN
jgi:hypothetical protein